MPTITIAEHGHHSSPAVTVDGVEYPFTLEDPFDARDEARLEWYFEQYLRFPLSDDVRAAETAATIAPYGDALFKSVFLSDPRAFAAYKIACGGGVEQLAFEVIGSPEFHRYHWEALRDPDLPQPFALHAPFVRRTARPAPAEAAVRAAPTVNVLLVTARPRGADDVSYRTISLPLVRLLRGGGLPVELTILRPATFKALADHLDAATHDPARGSGYYHIIHFDVHGALLTYEQFDQLDKPKKEGEEEEKPAPHHYEREAAQDYQMEDRPGRGKIAPYTGKKAFLIFEGSAVGRPDAAEAGELAALLTDHRIPIAVLNACQSARQEGSGDAAQPAEDTSLGSQLVQAGMNVVVAMAYSVTVSAAVLFMGEFYRALYGGADPAAAVRGARRALEQEKRRRAYFNRIIRLEDGCCPSSTSGGPCSCARGP